MTSTRDTREVNSPSVAEYAEASEQSDHSPFDAGMIAISILITIAFGGLCLSRFAWIFFAGVGVLHLVYLIRSDFGSQPPPKGGDAAVVEAITTTTFYEVRISDGVRIVVPSHAIRKVDP